MEEAGDRLVLPVDVVVADAMEEGAESETVAVDGIPPGKMGLDIGPETVDLFEGHISGASTIFWNGPMGVFEIDAFAKGTEGVARAVAERGRRAWLAAETLSQPSTSSDSKIGWATSRPVVGLRSST